MPHIHFSIDGARVRRPALREARRQAGLTLIEFMVSIVIGMLMVAALATLIANQSGTRAEVDKSGRMIENGRYAIQVLANDIQMAGYWGELSEQPAVPGALPDPCSVTLANLDQARGVPLQGYDSPATLPVDLAACVTEHKPETDVLVVRRVDPDMTALQTGGITDFAKLVTGQVYLQTGLTASGVDLGSIMAVGSAANATTFTLKKKGGVNPANTRRVVAHIYYVSKCSVQVGGSCTGADGGNPIPTLKRLELGVVSGAPGWLPAITIAEGIENLQIDYGLDTDNDGASNGADVNGSTFTAANWADVVTAKIHILARSTETSGGFEDTKSYAMGTAGAASAPAGERGYKRHAFVQTVRLVNPSGRRAP